jgi:transposase
MAHDREQLLVIASDGCRPLKHVQRARIILLSAKRLPVLQVAQQAGVSRPAVWRWQQRYGEEGIAGLLRDKTRKPGRAPLSTGVVAKVLALTCSEPPGEATHWTGCAMAKAVGMSLRAVQRLWDAHHLQPHRLRTFKRSNDPKFAEKVEDVAGLYMDPPAQCGPARSCRRRLHR